MTIWMTTRRTTQQLCLTFRLCCIGAAFVSVIATYTSAQAQIVPLQYDYGSSFVLSADREFHNDLLQEAKRRLNAVNARFPSSPARDRATMQLAEAQFRAGETGAGYQTLDSLILSRPNSPFVVFAYNAFAERLFEQKKFQQAHEYYAKTVLQAQKDASERGDSAYAILAADALFWDGIALTLHGKESEAQSQFLFCTREYPQGDYADDALFFRARRAETDGDYEQAIGLYARLIKTYPNRNTRLASQIRLAQNQLVMRRSAEALVSIDNAQLTIGNAKNSLNVDNVSIGKADKNYPISVVNYQSDSYVDHPAEQVLYLRGEAYNQNGRFDEGLKAFATLIEQYPKSPMLLRARLGAGYALMNQQRYDEALKQYDAVIDADNATGVDDVRLVATARLYRPLALKRKGDRDNARKELNSLSIRSDFAYSAQALMELGQMQYEDGKMDDARKTLERAAREAPDPITQTRVQLLLGETSLDAGYYSVAIRAFEKAQQLAEQTPSRILPNKGDYILESSLKRGIALVGAKQSRDGITALTKYLNQNPEADGRDEAAFWLAEAYYQSELMKNAEQAFQDFVKKYPDGKRAEEAWYGLGWTQFRTRQFTESAGTFTRMLREFPQSPYALDVLTRKGDGHYLTKQYRPAADAYRQASRLQPKSQQGEYAAFQLAQCLYRLQEFEQATTEAENFTKRYSTSSLADDAAYLAGWIAFQQKRYDEAVTQFKILADQYPDGSATARGYYAMGDALYNLGKYDDAIASYKLVADRFPSSPFAADAVNAMQYCLTLLGREKEANDIADKYININPNSALAQDVKFKKAELFFNGRKYENAITEYEDFIKKNPKSERNAEAMLMLAKSYVGMNDTTKAFMTFKRVEELYPQSPIAAASALEMGLTRLEQKRYNEADTLFAAVERKYPTDESAIRASFERANLREAKGDTVGAITLYRNVSERFKGSDYGDRCRYRVASWFRSKQQFDSARTQFEALTSRKDELGAEAQFRIGELYLREKKFQPAIEAFLKCKTNFVDIEDWYSLALLNLGICYEQTKNTEAAKEMYKLVVVIRKNDDFGKTAQQALDRLAKL